MMYLTILSAVTIFALAVVEKGLRFRKDIAWTGGQAMAILGLITPAFPIAILSLKELFSNERKSTYLESSTIHTNTPLSIIPKISVVLLLALTAMGSGMYFYYQKDSTFLDVAYKDVNYSLAPNLSVKELYEIGGDCNTYGETKCSLISFLQILKMKPGDTKALANLAMAQSHYGQHDLATINFQKVLDKGYETYDVYFLYGKSLLKSRQTTPALNAFHNALKINPQLIEAAAQVSLILVNQGKFEEALGFIQGYLKANPEAQQRLRAVQDKLTNQIGDDA